MYVNAFNPPVPSQHFADASTNFQFECHLVGRSLLRASPSLSHFSRKTLAINCSSSDIDVISPQQRSNLSRIEHAAQLILLHERCLVYPLAKSRIESLTSLPSNLTRSFIPLAMEEDETSSPFTFNGQSLVNNRISVSSF